MKIITQSIDIISQPENLLEIIEKAGRTCYKSEDKITADSAEKFVEMLIKRGHEPMIEFGDIIIKCITNRGVTHEIVRHRLSSYAQESTRYVDYEKAGELTFIKPVWTNILTGTWALSDFYDAVAYFKRDNPEGTEIPPEYIWISSMFDAEKKYNELRAAGWRPEQAREVLPNSLKTEIVWKANIREWRHIFKMRCAKAAHPQMRALMRPLLAELQTSIPVVFDDISY